MRLPKFLQTFWIRLALFQALVSAVLTGLLFGGLYVAMAHFAKKEFSTEIERDSASLISETQVTGPAELVEEIHRRVALRSNAGWYAVVDPKGHMLAGNIAPSEWSPGWHRFDYPNADKNDDEADEHELLTLITEVASGYRVAVARDTYRLHELQESFASVFAWVLVLGVVTGSFAALGVARALRRRVAPLVATATAVGAGDLARRVMISPAHDEFDGVGVATNEMLDHIQRLMQRVRQVSVDIAHELRTPLARVRQRLERLRDQETTSEATRNEVGGAIENLDEALSTFEALLRLARIEEGSSRASFAMVDLSALLREMAEVYVPVAEDAQKALSTKIADGVTLLGDRPLLIQMVVNGLENAIRHTPEKTCVLLRLERCADNQAVLDIDDNGEGISQSDRERALMPLVRLDASRNGDGSGVGLALCKAIAELHGGELVLLDAAPGLRLRFTLPVHRA